MRPGQLLVWWLPLAGATAGGGHFNRCPWRSRPARAPACGRAGAAATYVARRSHACPRAWGPRTTTWRAKPGATHTARWRTLHTWRAKPAAAPTTKCFGSWGVRPGGRRGGHTGATGGVAGAGHFCPKSLLCACIWLAKNYGPNTSVWRGGVENCGPPAAAAAAAAYPVPAAVPTPAPAPTGLPVGLWGYLHKHQHQHTPAPAPMHQHPKGWGWGWLGCMDLVPIPYSKPRACTGAPWHHLMVGVTCALVVAGHGGPLPQRPRCHTRLAFAPRAPPRQP